MHHLVLFDSCCHLVCIQILPWLHDEDTLVDSADATQRAWLSPHLHGGLLPWNG